MKVQFKMVITSYGASDGDQFLLSVTGQEYFTNFI
jgi:hypothetical protein